VKGYYPTTIISLLTGVGRIDIHARLAAASGIYFTQQDFINTSLMQQLVNCYERTRDQGTLGSTATQL
jgi:hypothetical protein